MRKLANLFICLFLCAALIDIADELLKLLLPSSFLTEPRRLVDLLTLAIGLACYLCMAFNRHLPKLLLLSLLGYLLWGQLAFWPLAEWLGEDISALCAAGGQLLLALLAMTSIRAQNRKSRLFRPSQFAGPGFSGRNLFNFALLNLLLLPVILLLLGFSATSSLLEQSSAGFVQLKPDGLYMSERVYRQGTKTIRLVGMIHLGQQDYFSALNDSISGQRTLILAEGVSDRTQRLQGKFSYGKLADLLGLASQEDFPFSGRVVSADSLQRLADVSKAQPDILPADIDLQEFDPRTIAVLNALGEHLLNAPSLAAGVSAFNRWANTHLSPETNQVVMADLLDKRNASLLGYLPDALRKYDKLVIPWGALHMAGIEQGVLELDFSLQQSRQRQSIDFFQLPYQRLWKSLTEENGR